VETDQLRIYENLFTLFDLIMRHKDRSPSFYQERIRSGSLNFDDILLGLQNKVLNKHYLYNDQVNMHLFVVGESIFKISEKIEQLIDKIINYSPYVTAKEIILLENIRTEIARYDFDKEAIEKDPATIMGEDILRPIIPVISYRAKNFYALYSLFIELQTTVLFSNSTVNREVILYRLQYLYHNHKLNKCKKLIRDQRSNISADENLLNGYLILCEYDAGNISGFIALMRSIHKKRPYNGRLVAQRNFYARFVDCPQVREILSEYYSNGEIDLFESNVRKEISEKNTFIETNERLMKYYPNSAVS